MGGGTKLINQKLILDLPAIPGPNRNGGKITLDKDNNLYVIKGNLKHITKLQNFKNRGYADYTGSIYRIDPHPSSVPSIILLQRAMFQILTKLLYGALEIRLVL